MAGCVTSSNLKRSVKFVALVSVFLGIAVFGLSSWILHKSLQMKKNHELSGKELLLQLDTFFGGSAGKGGPGLYDIDLVFRILISTTASALTGSGLQLVLSLALFLASIKGGAISRAVGKIWVYIHVLIMLTIGSATLCILTNELELNNAIRIFLIATGGDAILIIFFMWIVFTGSCHEEENPRGKDVGYHSPPIYTTAPANGVKGSENFKNVKLRPTSVV